MTAGQARRVSRALMRGGGRTPGGLTDIASIDDRHADDSLEERGMRAQKVPESQILMHRKSELEADASDIRQRIARLQTRSVQLKNRRQTLRNEMVKRSTKPARRAAIRGLLVDLNDEMTQVADAIYSLDQELRNVMRQQAELGFDITDAQAAEAEAAAAPATDTGAAQEYQGPSYTEILNANTNALNGEWWRTAMGSGDIGTGGPTALAAAGGGRWVTIRVDSGSLAGAVATAAGDQGAIPATIVPSGA
jgi:hypothetical protein